MIVKALINSERASMVDVEISNQNVVDRKCISYRDFINLLLSSTENEELFRVGKLPYGYVDSKISLMDTTTFSVVIEVPKAERVLMYYGDMYQVPFPNILMYFYVEQGKLVGSKCFATCGEKETLYCYPFGNVYEDGKICWGNVSLPKIQKLEEINIFVSMFFSSGTNDDLYFNSRGMTQRAMLEELVKLDEFPDEMLQVSNVEREILF